MNNSKFNLVFNKISYIYSELFLKLFGEYYRHIIIDLDKDDDTNFKKVFFKTFNNYKNLNYSFYYNNLDQINDINYIIKKELSELLKSDIDAYLLLAIIDKKYYDYYIIINKHKIKDNKKIYLYKVFINYLISKALIRVINILNIYKNNNKELKHYIDSNVEKYRNIENNMEYIQESYNYKYKKVLNKSEYKILIYLLCLEKNGKELSKKYNYNIKKILESIGHSGTKEKIDNSYQANNILELKNTKYNNNLFNIPESPYINKDIKEIISILFKKYTDEFNFIKSKNKILKIIFYEYLKNTSIENKIDICFQYTIWHIEWNNTKEKYLIY